MTTIATNLDASVCPLTRAPLLFLVVLVSMCFFVSPLYICDVSCLSPSLGFFCCFFWSFLSFCFIYLISCTLYICNPRLPPYFIKICLSDFIFLKMLQILLYHQTVLNYILPPVFNLLNMFFHFSLTFIIHLLLCQNHDLVWMA